LIADEPLTLVDTGPKTPEAFESLRTQFESLGFRIEKLKRIVLTHAHLDHMGLASQLRQISGADIYAHPWDSERFVREPESSRDPRWFARLGVPPQVVEMLESHWRRLSTMMDPIDDVNLIQDGDELQFSGGTLRVVHSPGHTPGHVCLFHAGKRTLLAADCVLKKITPNPMLSRDPRNQSKRFPSLTMFLQTVERLRELAPAFVYTGHGDDVDDYEAYRQGIIKHVESRQQRLLDLLGDSTVTPWEMSLKLFPRADDAQRYLALSETVAHFDLGVTKEKLVIEENQGVEWFRKPKED
jgi:glyoxylase-like metal-dependent hydrolase (beta-lactamase superfamily II)